MKTLCIVPCGQRKIWNKFPNAGPQKAKDVYTGPYASKCIQYAEIFYPDSWCILSAKYGFLFPNEIIPEPYEVTFKNKSTNPISKNDLLNQLQEKGLNSFERIVALGGKVYCDIIDDIFRGKTVIKPLSGKTLGVSLKILCDAINKRIPLMVSQ